MASEVSIVFIDDTGRQDSIVLDATLRDDPTDEVEVTEHAVEEGSPVTDHARTLPVRLSLDGVISETPITEAQALRSGIELPSPAIGAALTAGAHLGVPLTGAAAVIATAGARQYAQGYAAATYLKLVALKERRRLVTVATPRRTYENMMLVLLTAPRDARTGDALLFSVEFRQMRLVRTRLVFLPTSESGKAKKKIAKLGRKVTKPGPTRPVIKNNRFLKFFGMSAN